MTLRLLAHCCFYRPSSGQSWFTCPKIRERRGIDPITASFPFDDHGKSILMEAKHGHVAIHADRV